MSLFSKLFPGRPEIELRTFDSDDSSILFACNKELTAGEHDVQAIVGDHKMRCRIQVESIEAGLYYGHFLQPTQAKEHLAVLLPKPLSRQEKRAAKRVQRGLRVNSPGLPKFTAITSDFSVSGLKLKAEGAMNVGEEFEAQIEFDDETMSRINVTCKVVWCRPEGELFYIGASFENLAKPTASRIALFVQDLSKVEPGVVSAIYQFD